MYDYSKLLGRIKEKNLTQADFSVKIGVSLSTLNAKISNNYQFKQNEIKKACEILEIDLRDVGVYFFTKKV